MYLNTQLDSKYIDLIKLVEIYIYESNAKEINIEKKNRDKS